MKRGMIGLELCSMHIDNMSDDVETRDLDQFVFLQNIIQIMIIPFHINGEQRSNDTYNVTHPATGNLVHQACSATEADIRSAVDTCHSGLSSWSSTPITERCSIIRRAAELIRDSSSGWKEKMRNANMEETSATEGWVSFQLEEIPSFIDALVDSAEEALASWTVEGHKCEFRSIEG